MSQQTSFFLPRRFWNPIHIYQRNSLSVVQAWVLCFFLVLRDLLHTGFYELCDLLSEAQAWELRLIEALKFNSLSLHSGRHAATLLHDANSNFRSSCTNSITRRGKRTDFFPRILNQHCRKLNNCVNVTLAVVI